MSEKRNFTLDKDAQAYVDRMFPCEKPCDSYGVCDNCIDRSLFQAGYNFAMHDFDRVSKELEFYKSYYKQCSGEDLAYENKNLQSSNQSLQEKLKLAKEFISVRVICQCQSTLKDVKDKYPTLVCVKCKTLKQLESGDE